MRLRDAQVVAGALVVLLGPAALSAGCGLFEPRTPAQPSQSGENPPPATSPDDVITNLQSAVGRGSVDNYMTCLADPTKTTRGFTFIPSAQYASQLAGWGLTEERAYFNNLVTGSPNAFSNLDLQEQSPASRTSDSVIYFYNYTFTYDHNVPNFPTTVRGSLQFFVAPGNDGTWSIYRWADFKTVTDSTWSLFKLKFR